MPDSQGTLSIGAAAPLTALRVGSGLDDIPALHSIFRTAGWTLRTAPTVRTGIALLRQQPVPVVLSERRFPDGDWGSLLEALNELPRPPRLIVTCRLADERLWAEVLNLGGFDVIASPFHPREVLHVIGHAADSWRRQWHFADAGPRRPIALSNSPDYGSIKSETRVSSR
jgi:DNA-binding response OmpR family regulator